MKVLHLSSERTWRGGEQQIAYLMQELRKLGVENFAAARTNSEFSLKMKAQNFPVFELPFSSELDLFTAWKIKKIIEREKIDLVHLHSGHSHTLGVLAHVLGGKARLVLSKRTNYPVKNNFLSKWKFNYDSISKILCVSDEITKTMEKSLKKTEKLVTVYSGIDLEKFSKVAQKNIRQLLKLDLNSKIVMNSSAIAEEKDYQTFINVAELLVKKYPNLHFVIFGEGSQKNEMIKLVEEKKITNSVHFVGFRDDLTTLMPSADLFLMTSKNEGLGTSLLDAFVAKVAVVSTDAGGIPEIVKHAKTGLVASVGDVKMLANHVEKLLFLDSSLRDKLVLGAHQLVQDFSYQKTAQKTLEIYRRTML